jgi:glycogen debranching enzyme
MWTDSLRLWPEVRQPEGPFPVSSETEPLVLARGGLFWVANRRGDLTPAGARDLGLYHEDTRHLSYWELLVSGGHPLVLSSETAGATHAQVDLTQSDRVLGNLVADPQNFLHLRRSQLLDGELIEELTVTNHLREPAALWLELRAAADFVDVFEVRGALRERRGRMREPEVGRDHLRLAYDGLDGQPYVTDLRFVPDPARLGRGTARFEFKLAPGETANLSARVTPSRGAPRHYVHVPFDVRRDEVRRGHQRFAREATAISVDNALFQRMLDQALADLEALQLTVGEHRIVGAGIPWFASPFGRDALITSLEVLSVAPHLAGEALRTLAAHQGARDDPWREEEPGKILHELRRGEMARTGEIPHSPYYGTIDATPLWLVLLGETLCWQGADLVDELRPHAERALSWIERRLARGGGLIRYQQETPRGLRNQGWKDSTDGISFADGALAEPPIALVEVQGYAVAALSAAARVRQRVGDGAGAARLALEAVDLRARIERAFYVPETDYYALALDGEDRQVTTITSNPGHLLFTGALASTRAERVVDVLMSDALNSGWGVRTLARGQAVYNPLSYHNGSVWPHDNALCALGAARVRRVEAARALLEQIFDAALHFHGYRLPELYCGMARGEDDFLVRYPVSCSPQAWASGALFLLLSACLGLSPSAPDGVLVIREPSLPTFVGRVELRNLRVGRTRLGLLFTRVGRRTHADVLDASGEPLRVQIEIG